LGDLAGLKIQGSSILLKGLTFRAKGTIDQKGEGVHVSLKFSTVWTLKIVAVIYLILPVMGLFGDKVTLNGNPMPGIWERLVFASIFIGILGILILAIGQLKKEFIRKIVKDLKLTDTTQRKSA